MIDKKFKKFEMVIPAYGEYGMSIRKAGESILKTGPVLIDPAAELEFQMTRKEVERLKRHLEEFLETDAEILGFYVRTTDDED